MKNNKKIDLVTNNEIAATNLKKNLIIWDNIFRIAVQNGWTLAELGRRVGMKSQDIDKYKKGKNMGPLVFAKFVKALSVDVSDLLFPYALLSKPMYNDTEESLICLSILINLKIEKDKNWIESLSLRFEIDQDVIGRWIRKDHLPAGFVKMVAAMGYKQDDWLQYSVIPNPNIKKFKRLANALGVDIQTFWAEHLEARLGLGKNEISSILMDTQIPADLVKKIELQGISPDKWAV